MFGTLWNSFPNISWEHNFHYLLEQKNPIIIFSLWKWFFVYSIWPKSFFHGTEREREWVLNIKYLYIWEKNLYSSNQPEKDQILISCLKKEVIFLCWRLNCGPGLDVVITWKMEMGEIRSSAIGKSTQFYPHNLCKGRKLWILVDK